MQCRVKTLHIPDPTSHCVPTRPSPWPFTASLPCKGSAEITLVEFYGLLILGMLKHKPFASKQSLRWPREYEEDARCFVTTPREIAGLIMLQHVSISSVITVFIHFIYSSKRNSSFVSRCLSRDGSQPPQSNLWHSPRLLVTQRYEPSLQLFLQYISLFE